MLISKANNSPHYHSPFVFVPCERTNGAGNPAAISAENVAVSCDVSFSKQSFKFTSTLVLNCRQQFYEFLMSSLSNTHVKTTILYLSNFPLCKKLLSVSCTLTEKLSGWRQILPRTPGQWQCTLFMCWSNRSSCSGVFWRYMYMERVFHFLHIGSCQSCSVIRACNHSWQSTWLLR